MKLLFEIGTSQGDQDQHGAYSQQVYMIWLAKRTIAQNGPIKMSRKLEDILLDLIIYLRFRVSLKTSNKEVRTMCNLFSLLSYINKALQSFQEIQKEQRGGPG